VFREAPDALVKYRKAKEIRAQKVSPMATLQDRPRLAYLRCQGGVDKQVGGNNPPNCLIA
jgi:hypothetical protein